MKNYDVNFIVNLLQYNNFNNYLKNSKIMKKLFIMIIANVSIELRSVSTQCDIIFKDIVLSKNHINGIKKLINNKIFTIESSFFKKYKNSNSGLNEIYKALAGKNI